MKTLAIVFAVVATGYLGFVATQNKAPKVNHAPAPSPSPASSAAETSPEPASPAEDSNSQVARIHGVVLQVMRDGLIVKCQQPAAPIVSYATSIGGNFGGNNAPISPADQNRPDEIYGVFFIASHPQQTSKVDGDFVDVDARSNGRVRYPDSKGAIRTIRRFEVVKLIQ